MHWTLVTGAAKRLGAEICGQLAEQGHAIVVHYNTSNVEADAAVNGLRKIGGFKQNQFKGIFLIHSQSKTSSKDIRPVFLRQNV